jgi:hypothetical protein
VAWREEDIGASPARLAGLRPHADGDVGGPVDPVPSARVLKGPDGGIAILAARIMRNADQPLGVLQQADFDLRPHDDQTGRRRGGPGNRPLGEDLP